MQISLFGGNPIDSKQLAIFASLFNSCCILGLLMHDRSGNAIARAGDASLRGDFLDVMARNEADDISLEAARL